MTAPAHCPGDFALEMHGYSFSYPEADTPALDRVTFQVPTGSFTVLCGVSGSGKSTLLRAFKPELAVAGNADGRVLVLGDDPNALDAIESARRTGFVMQDPENQIVTDTVWHELAFGLENLGVDTDTMRRRVAETAHFFGIGAWFERKTSDLSGGQKQLLNLAAIVVMQPSILLLDEPTSQLDPIAAKSFFDMLARVNDELGITVMAIEHRLEDVLPRADRVIALDAHGSLAFDGNTQEFVRTVATGADAAFSALPAATRIARLAGEAGMPPRDGDETPTSRRWPVTVREGRRFLSKALPPSPPSPPSQAVQPARPRSRRTGGDVVLSARDLWFRYAASEPFVLRGVDFEVRSGSVNALVGGNGSGKSTLLSALGGARKPARGKVKAASGTRVSLLAQDPKTLFVRATLLDDLMEWSELAGYDRDRVEESMRDFGLWRLRTRHPFDLSGGEIQRAALAKVLLLDPDVLLLDEPVKGIDAAAKANIGDTLARLAHDEGKAVLLTTHDLEFAADIADTCSMMFGCEVTCTQDSHGFFQDNLFYSTAVSRITHGILPGCVTDADVKQALGECAGTR